MFTYNTMQTFIGAIGMQPLHMVAPASDDPRRVNEFPGELVDYLANLIKKGVFHQHGVDIAKLVDELGDCLWYIAALCSCLDVPLGDVLAGNLDKLRARYPEGWDPAASQQRDVVRERMYLRGFEG